jgi:hypothetical protein
MISGEVTNTNFIFYGLFRPGVKLTIWRNRAKHYYSYNGHQIVVCDWIKSYTKCIWFHDQQKYIELEIISIYFWKIHKIGICHFSANHAVVRRRAKTGWFSQNIGVIRILVIMSVSTLISANILYVFAKYRYCKFGNVFVFFFIWLQDHSQQFDAKLLQLSSV